MSRESWKITFKQGDSFRDRTRASQRAVSQVPVLPPAPVTKRPAPAPPATRGQAPESPPSPCATVIAEDTCARGEWCEERTVTAENGHRTVTPARTYRAFCSGCETYIHTCLTDQDNGLGALYGRLAAEIGEAQQADVMVKMPFGPSVPLSEAIDAHMRSMTEIMCSWEERLRDIDDLSSLGEKARHPMDSAEDLDRSIRIVAERVSPLLSLAKQEMMRDVPWWAVPEDADILTGDGFSVKVIARLDGEAAGREVIHLHYFARRLLLETNPPQPLLPDFRCRVCELKALRRASPPWHEEGTWYWSRCDHCGDEMTREDYDTNAKRWIAYEKAHLAVPVLGEMSAGVAA